MMEQPMYYSEIMEIFESYECDDRKFPIIIHDIVQNVLYIQNFVIRIGTGKLLEELITAVCNSKDTNDIKIVTQAIANSNNVEKYITRQEFSNAMTIKHNLQSELLCICDNVNMKSPSEVIHYIKQYLQKNNINIIQTGNISELIEKMNQPVETVNQRKKQEKYKQQIERYRNSCNYKIKKIMDELENMINEIHKNGLNENKFKIDLRLIDEGFKYEMNILDNMELGNINLPYNKSELASILKHVKVNYIPKIHVPIMKTKTYMPITLLEKLYFKYPNENWDIHKLIENPNITCEMIEYLQDKYRNFNSHIDFDRKFKNPNLSLDMIELIDFTKIERIALTPLEYFTEEKPSSILMYIEQNPNLTPEFIERHIDNWEWDELSRHPNITPEFIGKHIDRDWNWMKISININITPEFIEKHLDKRWCWRTLSNHPNITQEFIEKHLDKRWDWYTLLNRPNITQEFIDKHIDKKHINMHIKKDKHEINIKFIDNIIKNGNYVNWSIISKNRYITMEFIERYIHNIDFRKLSENLFHINKHTAYTKVYYSQRMKQTIQQTKKISEELLQNAWHPSRFYDWCLYEEEKRSIQDMFTK